MVSIGTHSGTFHADEALAVYMLKLLPEFKDAKVVRSRDNDVLEKCDIVVDVGGKYEHPKFYDHHQREFTSTFDDEHKTTKMSSAGLVYKHYGKRILSQVLKAKEDDPLVTTVYGKLYDSFIEPVDAYDNGVSPHTEEPKFNIYSTTLRSVVANLNPIWTEPQTAEDYDRQFQKASDLMGMAFGGEVKHLGLSWYPARDAVDRAFKDRTKYDKAGRLLVFDEYVPWSGHIYDLEKKHGCEIIYVLYPGGDSTRIQAVAKSQGSFESRKALPEKWRGLRDAALSQEAGIDDGVFVHAAGFMGGTKSRKSALKLAKVALDA